MSHTPVQHAWRHVVPTTTVIVPTVDEADNVLELTGRIRKVFGRQKAEVIFVDDSKNLRTSYAIVAARALHRTSTFHVRFVHRSGKKRWGGLSGAVIDGIKRARAERIIVMDGDLQHPPEVLPELIKASKTSDVVLASRYAFGGGAEGLNGRGRHFISRISTQFAHLFFPWRLRGVSDPMTGFFLVKRDAVDISLLRPKGFKILLEMLARQPRLRVAEIPFRFGKRTAGKSKGSLKQGIFYLGQLFRIKTANAADSFCWLPRIVQFGMVGGSVFIIGLGVLYSSVEYAGVPVLIANAVQLALTFWLNYTLNRTLTWRDRQVSRRAAAKFLVSRGATTVLNFYLFAWLIAWQATVSFGGQTYELSVHYLLANIISLGVITLINFFVSDRWAFADKRRRSKMWPAYAPIAAAVFLLAALFISLTLQRNISVALAALLAIVSFFLFVLACLEVWRMTYGYRYPEATDSLRFPVPRAQPKERFCLIVPARHEEKVLGETLETLAKQTHPRTSILSVICNDDVKTLAVARKAASSSRTRGRIHVLEYPLAAGVAPSKPRQLNYGLEWVRDKNFTVVGIIDAEDAVHPELLSHVDAAFADRKTSIVQGGVQLMDFESSWYSLHNVLEYWRWFSSSLLFHADNKFMPLGGNTVFIRTKLLQRARGWPLSLTEDCALGVRLSARFHARTAVYYEPRLTTREETPHSLGSFFRQRVRWDQGFFGEWRRGHWRHLPTRRQRWLAFYVLASPIIMAVSGLAVIGAIVAFIGLKAPVALAMFMYIPFIPLVLLLALQLVSLYEFGQAFNRRVYAWHYWALCLTFVPYMLLLNAAALWAMVREIRGDTTWQKTAHIGRHRAAETIASTLASPERP